MTLFPALLAIGLCLGASARAAGVPIEVTLDYKEEPGEIGYLYDNPCAYDREGKPVDEPRNCAGVVHAMAKPKQLMGWTVDEKDGQVTAYLEYVRVPFTLEQILRVSSDYPKDGCAYKATLEHETKHWKANVELYKKTANALKLTLERISLLPSKEKPLVSSKYSSERFRDQIDKLVHARIDDLRKDLVDNMRESVAELDDPVRYRKDDWSKCPAAEWKGK